MGVVATLTLSEATENVVAWQRFLPTGPIALLPLKEDLSSLVWSTTTEQASKLLELSNESFVDAINEAFWAPQEKNEFVEFGSGLLNKILQPVKNVEKPPSIARVSDKSRAAFPLGFGHATKYVAPGIALIGDAAHRVHPLAGLGVNLGFGDCECVTKILADAVYSGRSLGSPGLLSEYESRRQLHNFPKMLVIDALQRTYSTNFPPIVLSRSIGMRLTHALEPLKRVIVKQASSI